MIPLYKYSIILLSVFLISATVSAHENDKYKHGSLPQCYGWEINQTDIRKCYLDKEHKMCVDAIYNHGMWHISEPFKCDVEEFEKKEIK